MQTTRSGCQTRAYTFCRLPKGSESPLVQQRAPRLRGARRYRDRGSGSVKHPTVIRKSHIPGRLQDQRDLFCTLSLKPGEALWLPAAWSPTIVSMEKTAEVLLWPFFCVEAFKDVSKTDQLFVIDTLTAFLNRVDVNPWIALKVPVVEWLNKMR